MIAAVLYFQRASVLSTVTGTTCASESELRNTQGPIAVIPSAVFEVARIGILALTAIGSALNASAESVGPRMMAVPSVVKRCMMFATWLGSLAASWTSNVRF